MQHTDAVSTTLSRALDIATMNRAWEAEVFVNVKGFAPQVVHSFSIIDNREDHQRHPASQDFGPKMVELRTNIGIIWVPISDIGLIEVRNAWAAAWLDSEDTDGSNGKVLALREAIKTRPDLDPELDDCLETAVAEYISDSCRENIRVMQRAEYVFHAVSTLHRASGMNHMCRQDFIAEIFADPAKSTDEVNEQISKFKRMDASTQNDIIKTMVGIAIKEGRIKTLSDHPSVLRSR